MSALEMPWSFPADEETHAVGEGGDAQLPGLLVECMPKLEIGKGLKDNEMRFFFATNGHSTVATIARIRGLWIQKDVLNWLCESKYTVCSGYLG